VLPVRAATRAALGYPETHNKHRIVSLNQGVGRCFVQGG